MVVFLIVFIMMQKQIFIIILNLLTVFARMWLYANSNFELNIFGDQSNQFSLISYKYQ